MTGQSQILCSGPVMRMDEGLFVLSTNGGQKNEAH